MTRFVAWLAVFALLPALADTPVVGQPLDRIGVIGASVSDGVNPGVPSLATLIRVGIEGHERIVVDRANSSFGVSPLRTTQRALSQVQERGATLVVAADLFFWYGYRYSSQEERMTKLAAGLEALEAVECPILLGTVPHLNAQRIPPQNQPSAEQLAELNAAIVDWANANENVHLLPLAKIMVAFRNGEEITLAGKPFTADPSIMFQPDGIHLTTSGQSMLGMLILDAIRDLPELPAASRDGFVRELEVLKTRAVELDRMKTTATPVVRALKHLSRQAKGPVEVDRLKDVLAKKNVSGDDIDRVLEWLVSERAATRDGTQVTPVKGVEPIRR